MSPCASGQTCSVSPRWRRSALRALIPTAYQARLAFSRPCSSAMRIRFALNEPARPLSAVIRITPPGAPSVPGFMNGWSTEPTFAIRSRSIAPIASAYGRDCFCRASARRIFAAATCFIALVICCVFFSDRIRSLKNTQQITKAMKQVAAAKIRRAEALQKQSRPYADAIGAMLRDLIANVGSVDHPFMKPGTEGAPGGVILMTADKGLAGSFNANLIRMAELHGRENASLAWYAVGIKARNALRRQRGETLQVWPLAQGDMFANAQELAQRVTDDFTNGRIASLSLVSPKLVNMMTQRPELRQILPITAAEDDAADKSPRSGSVEFEPSPEFVLGRLLPKYLEFTLYSAMLETNASFYAAQLVAMNNATDNAKKLIDQNTIEMNKARQAAITKEILEIGGGSSSGSNGSGAHVGAGLKLSGTAMAERDLVLEVQGELGNNQVRCLGMGST